MGAAAERVPTRELTNWLVRLASLADPTLKQITTELGKTKNGISVRLDACSAGRRGRERTRS
jgi:hypothetical protein